MTGGSADAFDAKVAIATANAVTEAPGICLETERRNTARIVVESEPKVD